LRSSSGQLVSLTHFRLWRLMRFAERDSHAKSWRGLDKTNNSKDEQGTAAHSAGGSFKQTRTNLMNAKKPVTIRMMKVHGPKLPCARSNLTTKTAHSTHRTRTTPPNTIRILLRFTLRS